MLSVSIGGVAYRRSVLPGIGAKKRPDTVTGRILDCHDRIRSFAALARRLGDADAIEDAELKDAAARVRRYFVEAMPRHVLDEEQSMLPRLRGRDESLDAALAQMHGEHESHEADIARLVDICSALERSPDRRDELKAVAPRLEKALLEHLEMEETTIVPAIERLLDAEEQAAIVEEMRARRTR